MELLLSCGPFAVWIQGHPSASFSRNYKRVRSSCFSHTAQNYSIVKYLKATSQNQRTLHFFNHCCQVRHYSFSIKKMWRRWLEYLQTTKNAKGGIPVSLSPTWPRDWWGWSLSSIWNSFSHEDIREGPFFTFFQIPFHLCISLITTVMIRLSRCTIPLIFHPYVFTVQVKTWATHLQVTIIRCVLTVLVAGTPSRSEVVFYVV